MVLPVLLVGLAALAGCGGGGEEGDAEAVLDRAFRESIDSADLKLDAQLELKGLQGFDRPLRVQAEGPFVGGDGSLPKLDIDIRVGPAGTGQSVESGILSTGDRAFVKFGGQFYEQSRSDVANANRELAQGRNRKRGSLRDLGLNPRAWVRDAEQEDDEKVAGASVRHVSGRLDVRRMFADLNKLVQRSANAIGGSAPDVPNPLDESQLDQLAQIVEDPTFDVYVDGDDVIRRLSADIDISVPESQRRAANGIESGSFRFSIEFRRVNGEQTVEAPANAKPISELAKQLGGANALRGLSGGGAAGGTQSSGSGSAARPGPGGDAPSSDALKRYGDCLDAAQPDDVKALSKCGELLR